MYPIGKCQMTSCAVSLIFDDVYVRKFSYFLTVLVPVPNEAYFRAAIRPLFPGGIPVIDPKNFRPCGGVGGLHFYMCPCFGYMLHLKIFVRFTGTKMKKKIF